MNLTIFRNFLEDVGINWWKKYGDKVGMGRVQEWPFSNIRKPYPHSCILELGDIEKSKNDYHAQNNHDYHDYDASKSNVDTAMSMY